MGINRFAVGGRAQRLPQLTGLTALLPTTVAIVSLTSLLLLVQTSRVTSAGYDIGRLEQIRQEWRQRNHQLEYEIATLQDLDHVEEMAAKLGMVPATEYVYFTVDVPPQAHRALGIPIPTPEKIESENQATDWWQRVLDFITLWRGRPTSAE